MISDFFSPYCMIDVPPDGLCFYHGLLRNPNRNGNSLYRTFVKLYELMQKKGGGSVNTRLRQMALIIRQLIHSHTVSVVVMQYDAYLKNKKSKTHLLFLFIEWLKVKLNGNKYKNVNLSTLDIMKALRDFITESTKRNMEKNSTRNMYATNLEIEVAAQLFQLCIIVESPDGMAEYGKEHAKNGCVRLFLECAHFSVLNKHNNRKKTVNTKRKRKNNVVNLT